MNKSVKYMDGTILGSHDNFVKIGVQKSKYSYVVSFISDNEGKKAFFTDKNGEAYEAHPGMVLQEGGILKTNNQIAEVRSNSGLIYRMEKYSEFSIENTIEGSIPVFDGNIYVFGRAVDPFVNGGKYRTSCYMPDRPKGIIMRVSETVDAYYTLEYDMTIYEYDENGIRFPIFISDSFTETLLKADYSQKMRGRYKVISQQTLSNEKIQKLFDEYVNPIKWRPVQ